MTRAASSLLWSLIFCLFAAGLRLWLVADQRFHPLYWPHDDLLFVNWAATILSGEWLGAFNSLTMAKLPGYSMFIAAMAELGVPLRLAQHLIHTVAGLLLWIFAIQIGVSPRRAAGAFLLYEFSPAAFSYYQTRIVREYLYGELTVIFLLLLLLMLRTSKHLRLAGLALAAAATLSFCSVLREEYLWISPVLCLFLCALFLGRRRNGGYLRTGLGAAAVLLLFFGGIGASQTYVRNKNYVHYGLNEIAFRGLSGSTVTKAVNALKRIQADIRPRYVPVTRAMRNIASEASPSFASLSPSLERLIAEEHTNEGALLFVIDGSPIEGSLDFALMSAAAELGYDRTPAEARELFLAIANEIDSACKAESIRCVDSVYPPGAAVNLRSALELLQATSRIFAATVLPAFVRGQFSDHRGFGEIAPYYELVASERYEGLSIEQVKELLRFDSSYYGATHVRLGRWAWDPLQHYAVIGSRRGLDVNLDGYVPLDPGARLNAHPRLRDGGVFLLQQMLVYGEQPPAGGAPLPRLVPAIPSEKSSTAFRVVVRRLVGGCYYLWALVLLGPVIYRAVRSTMASDQRRSPSLEVALILTISALFIRTGLLAWVHTYYFFGDETERYLLPSWALYSLFLALAFCSLGKLTPTADRNA